MKRNKQKDHDFHFILAGWVREKLEVVSLPGKKRRCCGKIVQILGLMYPRLEDVHFSGVELESRYQLVDEDKEAARCNIHLDLAPQLYRRLKMMHQDLNIYSIAQLVRLIVRMFLDFVDQHGDNWEEELSNWMAELKIKHKLIYRRGKKIRQFLSFNREKATLITLYNAFFSPIHIYRC